MPTPGVQRVRATARPTIPGETNRRRAAHGPVPLVAAAARRHGRRGAAPPPAAAGAEEGQAVLVAGAAPPVRRRAAAARRRARWGSPPRMDLDIDAARARS
jgi:hypothetical protein